MGIWLRRLSWYAFGIGLIVLIYRLYPLPISELRLQMGDDPAQALAAGLALGALGTLVALGYAWCVTASMACRRFGATRPGVLNSVGHGVHRRGRLPRHRARPALAADWPVELAIGIQAVLYGLITRLAARDRPIGHAAALAGHRPWWWLVDGPDRRHRRRVPGPRTDPLCAVRATGHAGRCVAGRGGAAARPEELTPEGWEIVSDRGPGNSW
jgi:hypothetical protein